MKQHPLPFLAAILRIKNASLRIRPIRMPQRRHEDSFGVSRIDQNPRNLPRILQANVRPSLPAVRGPVHPVAISNIRAHVRFARSHINNLRIRSRHRDRPNRSNSLRVKYRLPSAPRIVASPNAAADCAKIEKVRLSSHAGHCQRSSATRRSNRPPPQLLKQFRVKFLSSVGCSHQARSDKYAQAQQNHAQKTFHEVISDQTLSPKTREYIALLSFLSAVSVSDSVPSVLMLFSSLRSSATSVSRRQIFRPLKRKTSGAVEPDVARLLCLYAASARSTILGRSAFRRKLAVAK